VEIHPAVGDGQLDDRGHAEQPQRGVPRAEAEHQQDGQGDLADRRDVGHQLRRRIGIFGPQEMQLEFVGEQRLGAERQGEPAVPFGQAGFPERQRERDAQDERRKRKGTGRTRET